MLNTILTIKVSVALGVLAAAMATASFITYVVVKIEMQSDYIKAQKEQQLKDEAALKRYLKPRHFDVNNGKRY